MGRDRGSSISALTHSPPFIASRVQGGPFSRPFPSWIPRKLPLLLYERCQLPDSWLSMQQHLVCGGRPIRACLRVPTCPRTLPPPSRFRYAICPCSSPHLPSRWNRGPSHRRWTILIVLLHVEGLLVHESRRLIPQYFGGSGQPP